MIMPRLWNIGFVTTVSLLLAAQLFSCSPGDSADSPEPSGSIQGLGNDDSETDGSAPSVSGSDATSNTQAAVTLDPEMGPCGRPWKRTVDVSYSIEGTWMYGRADACALQNELERFHSVGGKWIWQFGSALKAQTADEIKANAAFADCNVDGVHCVDVAKAKFGSRIAGFLIYPGDAKYSSAATACSSLDQEIVVDTKTYYRVVLPTSSSQGSCPTSGNVYVMFAVANPPDREELLLSVADQLDMKVLLAMPKIPSTSQAWEVDTGMLPTMMEWSRRVFLDHKARAALHASYAGVYQTFEIPLTDRDYWSVAYNAYGSAANLYHKTFPNKLFAVSPYWNGKKDGGMAVADIQGGARRMGEVGVDVVAPQDGRGTGRVALFWPFEKSKKVGEVDTLLARATGISATIADVYNNSTMDFYAAAKRGVAEANSKGAHVHLWANFEAFEPVAWEACGSSTSRGRTVKTRLDRAVMMEAGLVEHTISYMWDPFFTCTTPSFTTALIDEIAADGNRPMVDFAFRFTSGGKDGFIVRGFHIAENNPKFVLGYYDASWNSKAVTAAPDWITTSTGNVPSGTQEAFVPFSFTNLAPAWWIRIRAVNDLASAAEPYDCSY